MKYWNLNKINRSTLEKLGPIPKSISKVFDKFQKELDPNSEVEALEEFKVSKYKSASSELLINNAIIAANSNTNPLAASNLKNHLKGLDI